MRRQTSTTLRLTTILFVACALLGAKAAPVLAATFGEGTRSIVLCTGTGLVRVQVGPDGIVVDADESAAFAHADARHCDMVAEPRGDVQRRWTTIGEVASSDAIGLERGTRDVPPTLRTPHDSPPRAPPPGV